MNRHRPEERTSESEGSLGLDLKQSVSPAQKKSQLEQEDQCLTGKQLNQSMKYKTELCRNFQSGFCEFQEKCSFAHGPEELRMLIPRAAKYKTKYCKQFFEQGFCWYGARCQFKHSDLQPTAPSSRKNSDGGRLPVFIELQRRGEEEETPQNPL